MTENGLQPWHVALRAFLAASGNSCQAMQGGLVRVSSQPDVLDWSMTQKIHNEFEYDKQATHVGTGTEEAFRLRGGVCQDFAHVQIGCLRSLGIPARYVGEYLRTTSPPGEPRRVGQNESHAWLSVYCGPLGWINFDPTNAIPSNTDHVTAAWGRDYFDVAPIRGTLLGGGSHKLTVSLDVETLGGDAKT